MYAVNPPDVLYFLTAVGEGNCGVHRNSSPHYLLVPADYRTPLLGPDWVAESASDQEFTCQVRTYRWDHRVDWHHNYFFVNQPNGYSIISNIE